MRLITQVFQLASKSNLVASHMFQACAFARRVDVSLRSGSPPCTTQSPDGILRVLSWCFQAYLEEVRTKCAMCAGGSTTLEDPGWSLESSWLAPCSSIVVVFVVTVLSITILIACIVDVIGMIVIVIRQLCYKSMRQISEKSLHVVPGYQQDVVAIMCGPVHIVVIHD